MNTLPRVQIAMDQLEEIAFNHGLSIDTGATTAHLIHEGVEYVAVIGGAA